MKTKPIHAVERELTNAILLATILVLALAVVTHVVVKLRYDESARLNAENRLHSTLVIYTTNLYNRVGIITSSTEFIDFVRSGSASRREQRNGFISLMSRLPKGEMSGWSLYGRGDEILYEFGSSSPNTIAFPLCYLGDTLNVLYGSCIGHLTLSLDEKTVINELQRINSSILSCDNCTPIKILPTSSVDMFGAQSTVHLPITIPPTSLDTLFLTLAGVSVAGVLGVAIWANRRVRRIVHTQIIQPIVGISSNAATRTDGESSIEEIIELRYRRDLLQVKTYSEETQRRALANDLHDMLGGLLLMLKWDVKRLAKNNSAAAIQSALDRVDHLIHVTGDVIESLRPEVLDTLGLQRALSSLVSEWSLRNVKCSYDSDIAVQDDTVPDTVSLVVYRIFQESLTNLAKHSQATKASISARTYNNDSLPYIELEIADNGVGFVPSAPSSGHGLASIRDRVTSLDGKVWVTSRPMSGASVKVHIPLNRAGGS